jgi:predicted enzyme related to lactoylglutathione lyase
MTLRFEIFPDDLDVIVDFYTRVLRFRLTADRRSEPDAYVSLQRGSVRVGAARRTVPDARAARVPPAGVELVLEVDDVAGERDRVVAAGWPLEEDLQDRPWGADGLPGPGSSRQLPADHGPDPLIASAEGNRQTVLIGSCEDVHLKRDDV